MTGSQSQCARLFCLICAAIAFAHPHAASADPQAEVPPELGQILESRGGHGDFLIESQAQIFGLALDSNLEVGVKLSPNVADTNGKSSGTTPFSRTYAAGTKVKVSTAPGAAGKKFIKWTLDGVDAGTSLSITVDMSTGHQLGAVFDTPVASFIVNSDPACASFTLFPPDLAGRTGGDACGLQYFFDPGTSVTVTATDSGATITTFKWTLDGVDYSTNRVITLIADGDHILKAIQTPITYEFAIESGGLDAVPITVSPIDRNGASNGTTRFIREYIVGTNVYLTAPSPHGGKYFSQWKKNGSYFTTAKTALVQVATAQTLTAVYVAPVFSVTSTPVTGVEIELGPPDKDDHKRLVTPFQANYDAGTAVTLTAPAVVNKHGFIRWTKSGSTLSTNRTVIVDALSSTSLVAEYGPPVQATITSSLGVNVPIGVSPADTAGLADGLTPFTRDFYPGTTITLRAPVRQGYTFSGWQRDNESSRAASYEWSTVVDKAHTYTAHYLSNYKTLTVNAVPAIGADITVTPVDRDGRSNGKAGFARYYSPNTTITLTAPAANFIEWRRKGLAYSSNPVATVKLDQDYTMEAVFDPPVVTLSVDSSPISGGTVNVWPADNSGRSQGVTSTSFNYYQGMTVSLTALSSLQGGDFIQWLQDGQPLANELTASVVMDGPHKVVAAYGPAPYELFVQSMPPTSSMVTVSPVDRYSQGDGVPYFRRWYKPGTQVHLTAPATNGTRAFKHWMKYNSTILSTTPTVVVTMDESQDLVASYVTGVSRMRILSYPSNGLIFTADPPDLYNRSGGTAYLDLFYEPGTVVTFTFPSTFNGKSLTKMEGDAIISSTSTSARVRVGSMNALSLYYNTSIDNTAPEISIAYPTADVTLNVSPITVSGAAFDPAEDSNGLKQVEVRLNGGQWTMASGTTAWTRIIAPTVGANTIEARSLDNAGHYSPIALRTFTYQLLDKTVPTITITSPTRVATLTTPDGTVTLGGESSDDAMVTRVNWTNNRGGSGDCTGTTSWECSNIALQPGVNTLTVTAADPADNVASDSLAVTYVPPELMELIVVSDPANAPISVTPIDSKGLSSGNGEFRRTYSFNTKVSLSVSDRFGELTFREWFVDGKSAGAGPTIDVTMNRTHNVVAAFARNSLWYRDADQDGFGSAGDSVAAFVKPTGYVGNTGDCDDTRASINPEAVELCANQLDDNCDGQVDPGCESIAPPSTGQPQPSTSNTESPIQDTVTTSSSPVAPMCGSGVVTAFMASLLGLVSLHTRRGRIRSP